MCRRFGRLTGIAEIATAFHVAQPPLDDIRPDQYAAPNTYQAVIRRNSATGLKEIVPIRWGLVPSFSNGDKGPYAVARVETIQRKRSFKEGFRRRRCIVPADLYYQWPFSDPDEADQQELAISLETSGMFGMAGIWEPKTVETVGCDTFAILTTTSNASTRPSDTRMPVILTPDKYDDWLAPTPFERSAIHLLDPSEVNFVISSRTRRYAEDEFS